jgi:hypothetical protein
MCDRTCELTVKEFAAKERVTERTVRVWIDKGAVPVRRTPGGGIRILDRREPPRVVFLNMKNGEDCGSSSQ